jgi:hypothetical protein
MCPSTAELGVYRAGVSEQVVTVLDRMVSAGIDEDRARAFVISGAVVVDGERVSDPAALATPPARVVILPA